MTTNKINNKKYIGQHTKFNDKYFGSGKIIKLALKRYGIDNFEREILSYAYTLEELNKLEKDYIKQYNAIKSKEFYNIHEGGCGGDTYTGRDENEKIKFKIHMSKVTKGENNGMYNKKHTDNTIKLIKIKQKENIHIYQTQEFKNKMSEVTRGKNNGMYNKKHSLESIKLMSENSKGKSLGDKNGMYGKTNENAINGKKIFQYQDKNFKILVNIFNTVQCALKYLKIKGHTALDRAIKNKKEYKNYYWSKENKV